MACVAAAEPARLRSSAQQSQNLSPRFAWRNASAGLAAAAQPIAAFGSGYRVRGGRVAAAEPARLRSIAEQAQNLSPRPAWRNALAGLAAAAQPIAAFGSGYRVRGGRVAAAEPARLRSVAQRPQSLSPRYVWRNALAGLAAAAQPIAAFGSGYRVRGGRVAAAELARLRSIAQRPQSLSPRSAWVNASAGLASAARSIAGCASGYRVRGGCVAAAELARLRSVAQRPQSLSPRYVWRNALAGLASAAHSIAGCASGYRG
ncbi:hypothetical protein C4K11_2987 [Pseudomonas chlororaphis subsp. aureofaciens]|nr:hypothetical protein C4K12_3079 [Pseudomonas chlororaphis subsp. aureofaciens]AZE05149.1 hypothetical protein C4K11_2987 [Pseudomonas chlororaphis subsp. aureofaciens]AZE36070.1 hypothetical protein C4K06_3037 [Pseudomonas chlororaphis subsp. aureofaciens]